MRRTYSSAMAGALILAGMAGTANAVSFTEVDYNGTTNIAAPIYGTPAASSSNPLYLQTTSGSSSGVQRSPYEDNGAGFSSILYSALSPGGADPGGSSATYNLAAGTTTLSILWGSPDDYNHLQLWSGANGTGTQLTIGAAGTDLNGSELACYATTCHNLHWSVVTFTNDTPIGSLVLSDNGTAAFEYGLNLPSGETTPTPIPGALWLFGSVLAGSAGVRRWRKRKAEKALLATAAA